MGRPRWPAVLLLGGALGSPQALESDQYYAWGREIADATDVINTKVALEIEDVLASINEKGSADRFSCHQVVKKIVPRFRHFIFHELELWVSHTPLVERVPQTTEEWLAYREEFLYRRTHVLDLGTKVPPSPTIQLAGVRMGTDKLSHFFSEGYWYYRWYRGGLRKGLSHDEAELRAINKGLFGELTILGKIASGVFSIGDVEANYEGMHFYVGLCEGESPGLELTGEGWQLARAPDFRDHVTPKWDESYLPPVYGNGRWKKVRPVLVEYCHLLEDDSFLEQRRRYAKRDRPTPTENRVRELVEAGRLRDPAEFSLDHNCPATQGASETRVSSSSR